MSNPNIDIKDAFNKESDCIDKIKRIFRENLNEDQLLEIYQEFLQSNHEHYSTRTYNDLLYILSNESERLSFDSMQKVLENLIGIISNENGSNFKCLEIFTTIIQLIDTYCLNHPQQVDYSRKDIFKTLIIANWNTKAIIPILSALKEIQLNISEIEDIVNKIIKLFNIVEPFELPPIIYQLLILSTKGCKKLILEGIIKYFVEIHENKNIENTINDVLLDDMEFTSSMTAREDEDSAMVDPTIMLHITFAIKQDQLLGNEYLKIIKNLQNDNICKLFSPFTLALSCSIASEYKFGEQIFEVLKVGLVRHYKRIIVLKDSKWLRELMPQSNFNPHILLKFIKKNMINSEGAIKGLIKLGFILIETNKNKFNDTLSIDVQTNASNFVCTFGRDILSRLVRINSVVAENIVKQILNFISNENDITLSLFYIDLLSEIISQYPYIINDNTSQQREIINSLSFVDQILARKLIESILPSIKIDANFRTSLILFLRKALYSKENNTRKVAVNGFLVMLIQYKQFARLLSSQSSSQLLPSSNSSQIQADLHYRGDIDEDNILSYEMLSIMKGCLSYNADVKIIMYRGFMVAVDKNSRLCPPIIEYLMGQLKKFYLEDDNQIAPINMEKLLAFENNEIQLLEALPEMLICLSHCILKWKMKIQSDTYPILIVQVEEIFKSIINRFIKCQIVDFSLEKPSDITLNNDNKLKDLHICQYVCRMYEAALQISFFSDIKNFDNFKTMRDLFNVYKLISDYMKERSFTEKPNSIKHVYTAEFIVQILTAILENEKNFDEVFSIEMQMHFITVTISFLKRVVENDFSEEANKNNVAKHATRLLVIKLFGQFIGNLALFNKQLIQPYLNCIISSLIVINNGQKNEAIAFYATLEYSKSQKTQLSNIVDPIFQLINNFEIIVTKSIENGEEFSHQNFVLLLQIISKLAEMLPSDSKNMLYLLLWYRKLFKENKLDDMLTSKILPRLILTTSSCIDISMDIYQEFAQNLHACIGDIDTDAEVVNLKQYQSITKKSSTHVLMHLLTSLHLQLDYVDAIINWLKLLPQSFEFPILEEKDFDIFFNQIFAINATLFEVIQMSIGFGACLEMLMRTIIKFYTTLTNLIKLKIGSSAKLDAPAKYFRKLVKQTHSQFTRSLYPMINYIQKIYTEHIREMTEKKKGKKGTSLIATSNVLMTKDSKLLPNLIFSVEQYEKFLIQLEKKSKMILLDKFKLGTARDFRINLLKLNSAVEEKCNEQHEETQKENMDKNMEPSAKKSKLNLASKKKN